MTEIIILTGFLGTGKTSLINAFLESIDTTWTGVIVNEAGDTEFDGFLIAQASGDASAVRMLGNGCLCCQSSNDELARAIRELVGLHIERTGRPSERIIVEASGLARPGAIMRQLQNVNVPLAVQVVSTVDATQAARPKDHVEIVDQWAAASTLVLTKTDLGGFNGHEAITNASGINPFARVITETSRSRSAILAFGTIGVPLPANDLDLVEPQDRHGVCVHTLEQSGHTAGWDDYAEWFDNLAGLAGDRLLRVKALVRPIDGSNRIVQAVGSTFSLPEQTTVEGPGHVVVIARDFSEADFDTLEPTGVFKLKQRGVPI